MRPRWARGRASAVPASVAAAIVTDGSERLLASGRDTAAGTTVVAGRHQLYVVAVTPGGAEVTLARPWHLVDSGSWSGDEALLVVTWVDGHSATRVVLDEPGRLPETLRERVQASVVLSETLDLGERRSARVVVRKVLSTDALVSQAVLGTGVRSTDPGVGDAVLAGLERVREQVGLD